MVKESIKGNFDIKYKSNTCQNQKYITFYAKVTYFDFLNNGLRAHVSIYTEKNQVQAYNDRSNADKLLKIVIFHIKCACENLQSKL